MSVAYERNSRLDIKFSDQLFYNMFYKTSEVPAWAKALRRGYYAGEQVPGVPGNLWALRNFFDEGVKNVVAPALIARPLAIKAPVLMLYSRPTIAQRGAQFWQFDSFVAVSRDNAVEEAMYALRTFQAVPRDLRTTMVFEDDDLLAHNPAVAIIRELTDVDRGLFDADLSFSSQLMATQGRLRVTAKAYLRLLGQCLFIAKSARLDIPDLDLAKLREQDLDLFVSMT